MPETFSLKNTKNFSDFETVYTIFWLLGKLGISICSISLFVFGAEVFPSNIRSTCLGIASFFGNIGGMLPYQTQNLAKINSSFPVAFYCLLSLAGAIATFIIPSKGHEIAN
uniref:Major facilitator superfamily (MFS) profile domain-containing protein n=1 Tax=Panagrolaimus davidi TaxID=227884 RepID=A0A914PR82_9BILA